MRQISEIPRLWRHERQTTEPDSSPKFRKVTMRYGRYKCSLIDLGNFEMFQCAMKGRTL